MSRNTVEQIPLVESKKDLKFGDPQSVLFKRFEYMLPNVQLTLGPDGTLYVKSSIPKIKNIYRFRGEIRRKLLADENVEEFVANGLNLSYALKKPAGNILRVEITLQKGD